MIHGVHRRKGAPRLGATRPGERGPFGIWLTEPEGLDRSEESIADGAIEHET